MADQGTTHSTATSTTSGGSTGLAFVVGALVVVVGVLAWFIISGADAGRDDVNINIEGAGSAVEGAAQAVEDAAEGAAAATGTDN